MDLVEFENIEEEILEIADENLDNSIKIYLDEIGKYKVLSVDEQRRLLIKYQNEKDKEAYDKLLKTNLRLCAYVARKVQKNYKTLDLLDLIQECSIALMNSIEKYDTSSEGKFSTYACQAMINQLERVRIYRDTNIRVPYRNNSTYKKYIKFKKDFQSRCGRIPTKEEIITELNISEKQYKYILIADNTSEQSLNQTLKDKNGKDSTEVIDTILDDKNEYQNNEKFIDEQILKKALNDFLTPIEYYIIYYRFILSEQKSLEDIGSELNISRSYVNFLEKNCLNKIKPIIGNIQKQTIKKYSIKKLTSMNLTPLSPKIITTLHYLKQKLPDINYQILYTMIIDDKNSDTTYYEQKYFFIEHNELLEIINDTIRVKKEFFNDSVMNKIYENYKREKSVAKIFELDIKPNKNINYNDLFNYINGITYDDIKTEEYIKNLDYKSRKLIMKYFDEGEVFYKNSYLYETIKRDINLSLLGYYNRKKPIISKKEIKTILEENKQYLTENQFKIINEIYLKENKSREFFKYKAQFDYILLCLKFKIFHYFDNKLSIEQIRGVDKDLLTKKEKELIHSYYGIDCIKKTIKELAIENNLSYVVMHDKLVDLRIKILKNYFNLDNPKKDISKECFLEYINDPRYDFPDDTRKLLKEYLENNKTYKELVNETGYNEYQISNFITEGIRRANMYRYGVIKVLTLSEEELNAFFEKYSYDIQKQRIIKRYYLDGTIFKEIAKEENLLIGNVKYVIEVFYEKYLSDKILKVPFNEYKRELNEYSNFSVLTSAERKLISLKYGIKNNYNISGEKYTDKEIQNMLSIKPSTYKRQVKMIDIKIKERMLNIRTPEYGIISREELIEKLKDVNLPISDKEREILCHLAGVNGYEYLTEDELSKKYNMLTKSFKRRYQRTILSILQYENNQNISQISYEKDILPIEKYFSNYDRKILKMYYEEKLTAEQISSKINLTIYQTRNMINKIRITVAEILNDSDTAKKFDFDSAREVINSKDFYIGKNHDLLIEIYKMTHGEGEYYKHTTKEIKEKLNLEVEDHSTISNSVYKVMVEIEKYKLGIRHIKIVNKEEIEEYYLKNYKNMVPSKRKKYIRYLNKKDKFSEIEEIVSVDIVYELLQEQNKLIFNLDKTKVYMKQLILNEKIYLPKNTIRNIKIYFHISERELMSGKDKLKVLRLLEPLYKKHLIEKSKIKKAN